MDSNPAPVPQYDFKPRVELNPEQFFHLMQSWDQDHEEEGWPELWNVAVDVFLPNVKTRADETEAEDNADNLELDIENDFFNYLAQCARHYFQGLLTDSPEARQLLSDLSQLETELHELTTQYNRVDPNQAGAPELKAQLISEMGRVRREKWQLFPPFGAIDPD